jgi:ech hydrogenase subunit A
VRMPRVAIMMQIGMAGMFLAPFGMLISKWAVLKAVVDAYPSLTVFIAFGSAATLFFWVKWMGKLVEVVGPVERIRKELVLGESIALYGLSAATALACLLFPFISTYFIAPYVAEVYFHSAALPNGDIIGQGNTIIMMIMMAMVMLFPLTFFNYGRGVRVTDAYLGGANLHSSTRFLGSASAVENVTMHNYYLHDIFSEAWLSRWGVVGSAALLAVMFLMACL